MRRPRLALLREVSPAWASALRAVDDGPLDLAAAQVAHRAYVRALEAEGVAVHLLPAVADQPDGCFVEDAAIIVGAQALLTRPGAPSRRAEVAAVGRALAGLGCALHPMDPQGEACLEGGDVLRVGDRLFVGLSLRSNPAGIAALAAFGRRLGLQVVEVPLPGQMHLKGAVSLADEGTAVVDPALLDPGLVARWGLSIVEAPETVGANVLALGGGRVLVPAEAPLTQARLEARGLACRAVVGAEIHRADGRLTCLSLRLPSAGAWCA